MPETIKLYRNGYLNGLFDFLKIIFRPLNPECVDRDFFGTCLRENAERSLANICEP